MNRCLSGGEDDWRSLVAPNYAVGGLRGAARRGFEKRRQRDARYCAAVERWEDRLALLTEVLPSAPVPPQVWNPSSSASPASGCRSRGRCSGSWRAPRGACRRPAGDCPDALSLVRRATAALARSTLLAVSIWSVQSARTTSPADVVASRPSSTRGGHREQTALRSIEMDTQETESTVLGGTISEWLADEALRDSEPAVLYAELCQRLRGVGMPILRGVVAFRILHPLYDASTISWTVDKGTVVSLRSPTPSVATR